MNKTNKMLGVLLGCVMALSGCGSNSSAGGQPGTQTRKLNGAAYVQLGEGTLTTTDASIEGAATIVFLEPTNEDNNYVLEFTLADKGSLKLIANAGEKLGRGVEIIFSREGNRLKVIQSGADISSGFEELDASKTIKIAIDIHPHGDAGYWLSGVPEGEPSLIEDFMVRPKGTLWGLELKGAKVTKASIGAPKMQGHGDDEHDGHDHGRRR